jgi:hypothetical protein
MGLLARILGLHATGSREEAKWRVAGGIPPAAGDGFGPHSETGAANPVGFALADDARTRHAEPGRCEFADGTTTSDTQAGAVNARAENATRFAHADALKPNCAGPATIAGRSSVLGMCGVALAEGF